MLVIDDFADLVGLESLLKRVGFDVLSVNREAALADALLGFFPDLLISAWKSRGIDGLRVAARVKRAGSTAPRVAFLVSRDQSPALLEDVRSRVDAVLEAPLEPHTTLAIVAHLLKLDADLLIEKFDRLHRSSGSDDGANLFHLKERSGPPHVARDEAHQPGKQATTHEPVKQATTHEPMKQVLVHEPVKELVKPEKAVERPSERLLRYDAFLGSLSEPVDKVVGHAAMAEAASASAQLDQDGENSSGRSGINEREKRDYVIALLKTGKARRG